MTVSIASLADNLNLEIYYDSGSARQYIHNPYGYRLLIDITDRLDHKKFIQVLFGFYQANKNTQWFEGGVT